MTTIPATSTLLITSGAAALYTLSGSGQLSAVFEYVGYSGAATFTQSGGTNQLSCDGYGVGGGLEVGENPGSSGVYTLSGSGLVSGAYELVGWLGCRHLYPVRRHQPIDHSRHAAFGYQSTTGLLVIGAQL